MAADGAEVGVADGAADGAADGQAVGAGGVTGGGAGAGVAQQTQSAVHATRTRERPVRLIIRISQV